MTISHYTHQPSTSLALNSKATKQQYKLELEPVRLIQTIICHCCMK